MPNVTAADVAEYILAQQGRLSAMKLHRLLYYCQAWHLAWEGKPLFEDEIQAWANGPVVPAVYELHRGQFIVAPGFTGRPVPQIAASAEPEPGARPGSTFRAHVMRVVVGLGFGTVLLALAGVAAGILVARRR